MKSPSKVMARRPQLFARILGGLLSLGILPVTPLAADAAIDYMLHCQGCHLPDGSGTEGKVPSFSELTQFLNTEAGRVFLIQVPGTAQSQLDDTKTAAVLNWIVNNLTDTPNDFQPYTAAEVARHRSHRLLDVSSHRAALLAD